LNRKHLYQSGASLLEMMAVLLIIAIAAVISMPLLHEQLAIREIDSVARRFIAHAHFARGQALYLGESFKMAPITEGKWESGWSITSGCIASNRKSNCSSKVWLSHGKIEPVFFRGANKSFIDPHTGRAGILFNAAGAAKTAQGGFVANRMILGHQRVGRLERHLILGSGGRWRICDPARDAKRCH